MDKFERLSLAEYSAYSSELDHLQANWERWGRIYKNNTRKFTWKQEVSRGISINVRKVLIPILKSIFENRCAFCNYYPLKHESSDSMGTNTLEHFKPKDRSLYPEYAFQWENLYPCCSKCNGLKNNKFHSNLLRPDASDYNFDNHFYVNGDGSLALKTEAAIKTENIFGLNRTDLSKERRDISRKKEKLYELIGEKLFEIEPLKEMPYAFFIKRVIDNLKKSMPYKLEDLIEQLKKTN